MFKGWVGLSYVGRDGKVETHAGHHSSQVLQLRTVSVKSGMTSFSATIYSYRAIKLSLM